MEGLAAAALVIAILTYFEMNKLLQKGAAVLWLTADIDEAEFKKQIPAGRFCEPAEVADLAMFLISEQASYITGEVISINGGLYT